MTQARSSRRKSLIAAALGQGYSANEFQRNPLLAALRGDPAFAAARAKGKKK